MKKIALITYCVPLLLVGGCIPIIGPDDCILKDSSHSVDEQVVKKVLYEAFSSYEKEVGVFFHNTSHFRILPTRLFPRNHAEDVARNTRLYMARVCPSKTELFMAFSNEQNDNQRAFTVIQKGIIFVYSAGHSATVLRDKSKHPALLTTIKHELGHAFNLVEHSPDTLSFMYPYSGQSYGLWTDEVRTHILKNKFYQWNVDVPKTQ